MSNSHTVHSINTALVNSHLQENKDEVEELRRNFDEYFNFKPQPYYPNSSRSSVRYLEWQVQTNTVDAWTTFDNQLADLVHEVENPPSNLTPEHKLTVLRSYNGKDVIIGWVDANGMMDFEHLSELSKENAHLIDPDYYLSSVLNAPPDKRDLANEKWLKNALARTPIYTASFFASAEIDIPIPGTPVGVEIGGELSYTVERYGDGSVVLTFAIAANIGAFVNVKAVDISGGLEGGLSMSHRFNSEAEANAFAKQIVDCIAPQPSLDINFLTLTSPFHSPVKFEPDFAGAAKLLSDSGSLYKCIGSIGLYGEVKTEVEAPGWLSAEASLSASAGYKRDFVNDENILYFNGSAAAKSKIGSPTGSSYAGVQVSFQGSQHWNSSNQSYVNATLRLDVSTGAQVDQLSSILPGIKLSTGQELVINARLDLNDPTEKDAWKNFRDPFDGSLDLVEFFNRANLRVQTYVASESKVIDVDAELLEVEVGSKVRATTSLQLKAPGEEFREYDLSELNL